MTYIIISYIIIILFSFGSIMAIFEEKKENEIGTVSILMSILWPITIIITLGYKFGIILSKII